MSASPSTEGKVGKTILVAEDDEMDAFILNRAFTETRLPYLIKFVWNGDQAIKYLAGKHPYSDRSQFPEARLLLLDLKMPCIDGFTVLEWMQKSGRNQPPVLVYTGSQLPHDKSRALELGAREFHTKTGEFSEIVHILKGIAKRWLEPGPDTAEVPA
jgi:CheY-like chemotaxis protein